MINLPVIRQLSVDGYGLYPGTAAQPGLTAQTHPGLTLILGANGLGKTTLVTILFRMLSGPSDIPNIAAGGELGNRRLDAVLMSRTERRLFAIRVNDDAAGATASLTFGLGGVKFKVTRALDTLDLAALEVDGEISPHGENEYQDLICRCAKLASFGDWILILRHLVFYFEDRRGLVWDASAQRELLRLLFLPTDDTREWTRNAREILELDSLARNLGYAFRKEERALAKVESSVGSADEIRQQLKILERVQRDEQQRIEDLEEALAAVDADRQRSRVDALAAEQAYESAMRAVERQQLGAIATAFPSATETAKYLIGQFLAEQECLACGSHVPSYSRALQDRVREHECVVCGSSVDVGADDEVPNVKRLLTQAIKKLESAETRQLATAAERATAEQAYDDLLSELTLLAGTTSARSARINELVKMLPPTERDVHAQRSDLTAMRARHERLGDELTRLRRKFKAFVKSVNEQIADRKDTIKSVFDSLANDFLFEDCKLVWAPRKAKMGETGELIEFAAFELDMSGSDFESPVRRSGPQQVSESQREFIDLAFRMALMSAASDSGCTLVIDAPESSLDAVFVTRAADVLTRFAMRTNENRLVVTSNLVDGDLIPELMYKNEIKSSQDSRVVDLLQIAAPTAATKRLHADYAAVRRRLFERAKSLANE